MCALINRDKGWLMYLRESGDAGFSSRNPNYPGAPDETLEFYMENGQLDEYPKAWIIPIDEIKKALDFFQKEKKPPTFINWHNDSGDGEKIE
jgi:hypothetical protein